LAKRATTATAEEFIPTLTHATERDVDLLLVEELTASRDFLTWLAGRCAWTGAPAHWRVLHSKRRTSNRREIDIHVEIATGKQSRSAVLLIENKLSEDEQPDQAESYREELELVAKGGPFTAMVLVCPRQYAEAQSVFAGKFDAVVPYEDIAAFLRSRVPSVTAELAKRLTFRADLLDQAVHKQRRGYVAIPNEVSGGFNQRYNSLLARIAPEIVPGKTMLKDASPDESVSMIYDQDQSLGFLPDDLRPRRFSHELGRNEAHRANYVAVVFSGWGSALPVIRKRLERDTQGTGFRFAAKSPTRKRPNPGLVMSLATSAADNQGDFESQRAKLEEGIRAAMFLRNWLRDHEGTLKAWRDLVAVK
jgi:hypothetical protein